ncbi:MAG: type II secretion system F family protein [Candidatus Omnitrophica bacterium]|nr:type II secretion system F family protein [Candidatus Omnitrophota bacterium]
MANFSYQARDEAGKLVKGVMAAESEIDLAQRLRAMGYFLTQAKETRNPITQTEAKGLSLGQVEVLNFTTQVAISLDAGVPLLTVLKDLAMNTQHKKLKALVEDIARRIESGCTFKEALSQHPRVFSRLYVSIVGAGESTGKLALVLEDLARLIEWQLELQARVKEASVYPIILFFAMVGVVTVLMALVIPKFEKMFAELDVELPLPTQLVLGASKVWWIPLVLGVIFAVSWSIIGMNPKGRFYLDRFKLKIPVIGDLLTKIALSRFCHVFALALRSGVNVYNALGIAAEVTGNIYLEKSVAKAKDYVNVGEKIATSLELAGQESGGRFPDIVIRMIKVGEQSGSLADTLEKVNQYYDKEVPSTVKKIFAMVEPVMILMMGIIVGGIAMSVFLPLTKLITAVGGGG